MRNTVFVVLLSLSTYFAKAQVSVRTLKGVEADTAIFTAVELEPRPSPNFGSYMFQCMQQLDSSKVVQGNAILKFIVEKNGSLSSIRVIKSLSKYCDSAVVKMLTNSPEWKPASNNNNIVRCWYTFPIGFTK